MSWTPNSKVSFAINAIQEDKQPRKNLIMRRLAYTYDEIDQAYSVLEEDEEEEEDRKFPSICSILEFIPILKTIRRYKWQSNILSDILSGTSVAFLHLPQGLAYGLLASLSPISGLYTSFLAVAVYAIFGTCPQISIGTNSVLSLITAAMVEREELAKFGVAVDSPDEMTSELNSTAVSLIHGIGHGDHEDYEKRLDYKLEVATTAACISGIILFLMGVLRMGFLTSYMPSSFVGGFTTGAALHIATSQVKHIFRIKIPTRSGIGKLLLTYKDIALEIKNTNIYDTIICVFSLIILFTFSLYINPKINAKIGLDLPINLILVLAGIALSERVNLHDNFGVAIVGKIPVGLATPQMPHFSLVPNIIQDCIILAVITFAMTISMAMLMAKLHSYELDSNKELLAYGICNSVTSFFPSQACSASPARTMILSNTGAKTVLNGIPTAAFLLVVILYVGTLFQNLPISILAAMILAAVKDLMMQVTHVPGIWRVSKSDAIVWVATCTMTSFMDLQYGVAFGILIAVFGIIVNNQLIQGTLVAASLREDLFIQGENRIDVTSPQRTRIFYFPSQLFFANAELFKKQLFQKVFDPTIVHEMDYELMEHGESDSSEHAMSLHNDESIHCIILDCSAMTYIDFDGVSMLKMVIIRYNQVGVQMLLARCPKSTMETLERAKLFQILPRNCVFHDIEDAIAKREEVRLGISRLSVVGTNFSMSINPPIEQSSTTQGYDDLLETTERSSVVSKHN